jgi:hypothetical protein
MTVFSWFTRARAKGSAAARTERPHQARNYNAVEVVPGEEASCEAARSLAGKRFLPEEAPLFPLRDCDQPNCDCRYRRHPDRRGAARRVTDLGLDVSGKLRPRKDERRNPAIRGRRVGDQVPG